MKQFEDLDEVAIAIIDVTYGGDEETYDDDSQRYKCDLIKEFGGVFEDSNVGPGADIPAFLTVVRDNMLPVLPWLFAAFFSGKPILDNFDAWSKIALRVRRYFSRPLVLSRNGAAVLAVEAVFNEMGGIPRSLKLNSYRPAGIWEAEDFEKLVGTVSIDESPPILRLGMVFHLFEIEADGVEFMVGIKGKTVLARRLETKMA